VTFLSSSLFRLDIVSRLRLVCTSTSYYHHLSRVDVCIVLWRMSNTNYFALGAADETESTQRFFTRNKFLPSLPTILPHRLRRKFRSTRSKIRSRQTPTSSISALQTSFNPKDTLRSLRDHHWSVYDAQYLFLAFVGIFALCVIQSPGPMVKTAVATLLMLSLLLPVTRQFFLPFLPIAAWLVFFFSCQYATSLSLSSSLVNPLSSLSQLFFSLLPANTIFTDSSTANTDLRSGSACCPLSKTSSTAQT
jgi:hypothetical protein